MSLGTLEVEILNIIWQIQKDDEDKNISVKDVVDYLSHKHIERAYTTVKTVMDRLSTKEYLIRYRVGKKFYYKSVMDKEELAKVAVEELLCNFFNGSRIGLIEFLEKEFVNLVTE